MLVRRLPWFALPLLASAAALGQPQSSPTARPSPPDAVPDDDEPPLPLVPLAPDTLGGHFVLGVGGSIEAPFGELDHKNNAANLGAGLGVAGDLGFGLSRSVVIGAWGTFARYGSNGTSFGVGPFVRYHLVQGVRFDPWILLGTGFRSLSREVQGQKLEYSGVEIARLAVGGDYYPWSAFGFGPWLELDVGAYGKRPEETPGNRPALGVHLGFVSGLRLLVDLPGK